jgi:hypothetical protein
MKKIIIISSIVIILIIIGIIIYYKVKKPKETLVANATGLSQTQTTPLPATVATTISQVSPTVTAAISGNELDAAKQQIKASAVLAGQGRG